MQTGRILKVKALKCLCWAVATKMVVSHQKFEHKIGVKLLMLIDGLYQRRLLFSNPKWNIFPFHFQVFSFMEHPEFPSCTLFIFNIHMVTRLIAKFNRLKIKLPAIDDFIKQVIHNSKI